MEKSIENLWKEYMSDEPSSAPVIRNFADLKSIHLTDAFRRTYKTNVIILALTAVAVLVAFILGGIPFLGIFMFGLFISLATLGQMEIVRLDKLDNSSSNYRYITSLKDWLNQLIAKFSLIYRIWIPLLFTGFAMAILRTKMFVPLIGETLIEKLSQASDTITYLGLPLNWLLGILFIAAILSYFSNRIFKMEMKSIYGNSISKLNALLKEFESIKRE